METIKKFLKLPPDKYYIKHLEIINPLLPIQLTPKEIEVLGNFMSLEGEIAEEDRFGTTCRKVVKDKLNLSDGGLGNYIKSLKDKGFIITIENDKMDILEFLKAENSIQKYMFILTK